MSSVFSWWKTFNFFATFQEFLRNMFRAKYSNNSFYWLFDHLVWLHIAQQHGHQRKNQHYLDFYFDEVFSVVLSGAIYFLAVSVSEIYIIVSLQVIRIFRKKSFGDSIAGAAWARYCYLKKLKKMFKNSRSDALQP